MAKLLSLGAGVDSRNNGFTPLLAAAYSGFSDVCEVLLGLGKADIEDTIPLDERTALSLASSMGHVSTVTLLLSHGARVDNRSTNGFTPLLTAAQHGHTKVCELLLERGEASVKERSLKGFTPFLVAAQGGHSDVCELLLAHGSDIEERQPVTLDTALHEAAIFGYENLLNLLISHKADVNSRDRIGTTPLHLASQEGHISSVMAVLEAGADPLLPQEDGDLPIHCAASRNQTEVVKLLIERARCSPDQVKTYFNKTK